MEILPSLITFPVAFLFFTSTQFLLFTVIANSHGGNGHGKGPKVKSKNYASPDCGSKLLTANPEATHASKVREKPLQQLIGRYTLHSSYLSTVY